MPIVTDEKTQIQRGKIINPDHISDSQASLRVVPTPSTLCGIPNPPLF